MGILTDLKQGKKSSILLRYGGPKKKKKNRIFFSKLCVNFWLRLNIFCGNPTKQRARSATSAVLSQVLIVYRCVSSLTRFTHCSAQTGVRRMYGVTGCRYTRSTSTKEIPLPQHMQSCHYTGSLNWRKCYRELIAQKQRSQLHHTARCSTRLHPQSERRRLVILSTVFYTDPVADSFHTRQDQRTPF